MSERTRCLPVGPNLDSDPAIHEAARLLRAGELVAFPTETVYGLGANAHAPEAVEKIFAAKQRPSDNPLIIHIGDLSKVADFCSDLPQHFHTVASAFWPGPLTMVLPARKDISQITRGLDTVALRIPQHDLALALLRQADIGVAAPSANLSGRPSPTQAAHVMADLNGRIAMVLDGGPCPVGIESTVLDLTGPPRILRPGTVTPGQLSHVLGIPVNLSDDEERKRHSPGTRYKHYSPDTPVLALMPGVSDSAYEQLLAYLMTKGGVAYLGSRPWRPSLKAFEKATRFNLIPQLYRLLREWDRPNIQTILVDGLNDDQLGLSLMDRLSKAAELVFHNDSDVSAYIQKKE